MKSYLSIPNWGEFQHYKDRTPPWIKLHNQLLENYEFECLPDASKAHLLCIWLLASRTENKFVNDSRWIGRKIGANTEVNIKVLVDSGFLQLNQEDGGLASKVLQTPEQDAGTEREREREGKKRESKEEWEPPKNLNMKAWSEFEQHRKDMKKPLTNTARTKAANQIKDLSSDEQQGTIDKSIQSRWAGLFPEKGKQGNLGISNQTYSDGPL